MQHLIIYEIIFIVIIQYILAVFGDKPKAANPCPDDFLRIHNKCYYFSREYETFHKAKWKCEERNSTLAVINSKSQNNALTEFLRKGYFAHVPRWMGGQYDYKSGDWKWAYNGKPIRYNQFHNDISKNLEWHCLIINPHKNYKWDSSECYQKNYYICQTRLWNQISEAANITSANDTNSKNQTNNKINSTEQHDSQPGFYIVDSTIHDNQKEIKETKPKPKPKKKLICPKDYILLGRKCYFLSRDKAKWDDAYYKCQDMPNKSDLAIVKNKRMNTRLQAKVKKLRLPTEKRWIGGKFNMINNEWIWAATGHKLPFEPHVTIDLKWACVLWDPLEDRWTTDSCFLPMYYMCQTAAKPINRKLPMWKKQQKSLQSKAVTQYTH